MNPDKEKQDWLRVYAGLALIGLTDKLVDPNRIALMAFEIAKAMVDQEEFDD